MQRAGKIICWLAVVLIALLLLKPPILQVFHLQFYSPWQLIEANMQRYLQIAVLLPVTLVGTLQGRYTPGRLVVLTVTLGLSAWMIYLATRNLDKDLAYPTQNVKELFQNTIDPTEKIILQTDNDLPDNRKATSAILKVKPFSRDLQIVHAVDTARLEAGKWKRVY